MAVLSQSQIYNLALSAGLSPDAARIASAIAMAESSGNTRALNMVGRDNSFGLWQINMLGSLGPDRRSKLGLSSNDQLFDPATNARAMVMISSGGRNWTPWTTYTSGKHRKYLQGGSPPPASSGGGSSGPAPGGSGSGTVTASALPIFEGIPTWAMIAIGVAIFLLVKK